MKNKILLITALLSTGAIYCAQQSSSQPIFQTATVLIPIECSDDQVYVDEQTLEKFNFFAGLTDSYGCSLSDLELERTRTEDYSLVCSVRNNEIGNAQFHMDCTTAVMQLLVDFIEIPEEYLEEQSQALQQRLLALSLADLASLVKIVDQLWLQEPYLTQLETLLIPIFRNPSFIQGFLHDQSVQELVYACQRLNWKHLIPCPPIILKNKYCFTNDCQKIERHIPTRYQAFAYSPDKTFFAGGIDYIETVRVINTKTKRTLCIVTHDSPVNYVTFSPDGKLLATGSNDHTAKITKIETGQTICTVNHTGSVRAIAFSPDGKFLATGSDDNTANITNIETNESVLILSHNVDVTAVTFSPDGTLIATHTITGNTKITKIETNQTVHFFNGQDPFGPLAFYPNEKIFMIGNHCIPFEIYDATQSFLIQSLENHTPRLCYEQLPAIIQELLLTLPQDLQTQLVCNIPE